MSKTLKWALAIALAIGLPALIAPLLPAVGVYYIEGQSIIPPTPAEASTVIPEPPSPPQVKESFSQPEVRAYVKKIAKQDGVNVQKALWIIDHESSDCWREGYYDPAIAGAEPDGSTSYGCWQFNDRNAGFDMAVATSFESSTALAMTWILNGQIGKWTTYADCRKYFPDTCPF